MDIKLVMFKADGQRREFAITHPVTIIGRKHTCDLRVPISSVSREHCQVELRDDGAYIRDLGSSNGTFYNDQRVTESLLGAGDTIVVGPVHFTVVIDGEPADIEPIATVIPGGVEVEEQGAVPAAPAPAPAAKADESKSSRAAAPAAATGGASDEDDDFQEDSALEIVAEDTFDEIEEEPAPPPKPKAKPAASKPDRPASPVKSSPKPAPSPKGRPSKPPADDEVTEIATRSQDDDDAAIELVGDDEPKANTDDALAALMSGKSPGKDKGPAKPTGKKPAAPGKKEPAFDADDPIAALEALANAEGGPATDDDALAWLEEDDDDKD